MSDTQKIQTIKASIEELQQLLLSIKVKKDSMKEQVDDSSGWDVVEDSQTQEDNINEVTNEVTNEQK